LSVTVIHEKCDLKVADNKELPYSAYIIQYEHEGTTHHDVAVGDKAVDIFDYYYDKYKKGFKWLKQSQGLVSPKLWNNPAEPVKPKRKKRKKPSSQEEI